MIKCPQIMTMFCKTSEAGSGAHSRHAEIRSACFYFCLIRQPQKQPHGQGCGQMNRKSFFPIPRGEQPKTGRSGSYSNLIATRSRDQGARAFRKICLFSIPGRKFRYLIGARKKYKNAKLDKTLPKLCQKRIFPLFSLKN